MTIKIRPPRGNGTIIATGTTLTHRISADGVLNFEILEDEYSYEAISAIQKRWIVSNVEGADDDSEYIITIIDRHTIGNKQVVDVTAREMPIDNLMKDRFYANVTGSFTAKNYFDLVFKGTGMNYVLNEKVSSSKFENAGDGDTRLEMFKQGLEHYGLEYRVDYNKKLGRYVFTLTPYANQKANYYISDEINANALKIEEDATEFATFIMGFGDYEEEQKYQNAGLVMEFEHPLAEEYGKIHAEPFKDGRVKNRNVMAKELESRIKKSLKQSLLLDFLVLREEYPEAKPKPGDIVRIKSEKLGINNYVRIVETKTVRDKDNIILKQDLTLGDFDRESRYMKAVNDASKYISGFNDINLSSPSKAGENMRSEIKAAAKSAVRLISETEKLKDKQNEVDAKSVTTKNGTIVHDFTSKSNIRYIKSIGTIGDSVAKGTGAKTNFTQYLAKKLKKPSKNIAVSGATMSTVKENSIYDQSTKIKGDLIIIQGTDDDWINNVKIGTDRTDIKTFYGAFCSAINNVKQNNPDCKVLVMTATKQCYMKDGKVVRKDTTKNELGLTLQDYVDAQLDACNELDVPVFDAYRSSHFKPYNPAYRKANMPDGLHPNEKVHEVIMYELITDYYQFYG